MIDKDKTRQKLVDSMRKTKAAASDQTKDNEQSKEQTDGNSETKVVNPITQSSKSKSVAKSKAARTSPGGAKREPRASKVPTGQDPYQSGRRVWPD
jgi:hypothetical protein